MLATAMLWHGTGAFAQAEAEAKSPVNLRGAAKLKFASSAESYDHWERFPGSWSIDFALEVNEHGKPQSCGPARPDIADEFLIPLCEDLLENAEVEIQTGFMLGGRNGIVGIRKEPYIRLPGLEKDDADGPSPFSFNLAEIEPSMFTDYEQPLPTEKPMLDPDQGAFSEFAKGLTYPVLALRTRSKGVTRVLVGFTANGEVDTCRPIESAGSAILDNSACLHILQYRGRKLAKSVDIDAERYFSIMSIRWAIPSE